MTVPAGNRNEGVPAQPNRSASVDDAQLADTFFNFLRDMLDSPEKASLDLAATPVEWRDFAKGLLYIDECLIQVDTFARELANGNLDAPLPNAENNLAGPLKSLQSGLSHLAWQAREVANGNYDQHVDFMGDLGQAFNTMVDQLNERETALQQEKESLAKANRELQSTHEMVSALAVESTSFIIIYDDDTKNQVFATEIADQYMAQHAKLAEELTWTLKYCSKEVYDHSIHWKCKFSDETGDHQAIRFSVASHCITWNERRAVAHLIVDDTEEFEDEMAMQELVYRDPLTGLFNRRYGMEQANKLMKEGTPFSLAFIDLDNLKFCNDTFGHNVGDDYIVEAANMMRTIPQPRVICRIGGDEFMVIAEHQRADDVLECLKGLNRRMLLNPPVESIGHFRTLSYGVTEVPAHPEKPLTDYLEQADEVMYARKQRHKAYLEMKTANAGNRRVLDTAHRRQVQV